MSGKVRITQEQADAIEHLKVISGGSFGTIIESQVTSGGGWVGDASPANDMALGVFADALYIGYEVEEIAKEKERDWWKRNGREPWELKEDDILYYDGHIFAVVEDTELYVKLYSGGEYSLVGWSVIKNKYAVACFYHDRKDVDHE